MLDPAVGGERFSWRWPNGCRAHRSTSSLVFMVSTSIRSPSPRLERHSRCGRVATLRSTRCGSATIWSMIPSQRSDSISSSGIRRSCRSCAVVRRQPGATSGARRTLGGCGWLCRRCRRLLARRGRCARRRGHRCPGAAGIGAWRSRCPLCSGTAGPVGAAEGVVGRSWSGLRRRRRHRCARVSGGDAPPTVDVDGVAVDRPSAASWAPLLAAAAGVPVVPRPTGGATLGDVARVTAGFRDQYYGLTDAVADDAAGAHPLVTSGVIDPLDDGWGRRPTRFAKRSFDAPRFCSTGSTRRSAPGSATDSCPRCSLRLRPA